MRVLILMVMALCCHAANAEVFKCIGKAGKTVYQEKPCEAAVKEQLMDIKADPVKEAEAKARLEALEMENKARREERLQEEEDAATKRYQAEQINALKRSAIAQQQQAVAQRRQAEALERQNQPVVTPWWVFPRVPTFRHEPGGHADYGVDHELDRRNQQNDRSAPMVPFPESPSSSLRPGQQ